MESILQSLIGTWKLLAYNMVVSSEQGESTVKLAGDAPLGRIVFTSSHFMSVHVTSPHAITPTEARSWYLATDEEVLRVARPNVSYCGSFELKKSSDGGGYVLATKVIISLDPNWVGTTQIREVQMEHEGGRQLMILHPMEQFDLPVSQLLH